MRVLLTGNMGYLGSVLVKHLRTVYPDCEIVGYDSGFFAHCLTGSTRLPESYLSAQYFGDVRAFPAHILEKTDAVVHYAAVSNDPIGKKFEKLTDDINHTSTVAIARMAAERGVKNFIYASSCSLYGAAEGPPKTEGDALNPLTAYARSKADSEKNLQPLANKGMQITAMRYSTACGMSDRLRLDLVLNDFVACALLTGEIKILSDGTPWRPLIDARDIARAVEWAIGGGRAGGEPFLAVNVGSQEWNYQVHDLAEAVARAIPGTKISLNKDAPPDKRSYRVNFDLFKKLAPHHQPQVSLDQSIDGLKRGISTMRFPGSDFRSSDYMRLKVLEDHLSHDILSSELQWKK
jgi:nucleoside-diphosphate-sugar epimerase